jgi:hypothetical protein
MKETNPRKSETLMDLQKLLSATALLAVSLAACGSGADTPEASAGDGPASVTVAQAPGCFIRGATQEEAGTRPSPLDSAMVTLGGAEAKLCYGAPSANEREVMGGLVPYDAPWRTGANEATALHLTFPAQVAGVSVPAGSYSLYTVPTAGDWQLVVNGVFERWGIPINEEVMASDIGSGTVTPEATEGFVERMTARFDPISPTEAHLVLEWENTRVRIPVVHTGS